MPFTWSLWHWFCTDFCRHEDSKKYLCVFANNFRYVPISHNFTPSSEWRTPCKSNSNQISTIFITRKVTQVNGKDIILDNFAAYITVLTLSLMQRMWREKAHIWHFDDSRAYFLLNQTKLLSNWFLMASKPHRLSEWNKLHQHQTLLRKVDFKKKAKHPGDSHSSTKLEKLC